MSEDPETQTEREQRLNDVMAAYVQATDAGHAPDRAEILARHPDLADDLEAFFADHDRLNRPAGPLRAVAVETADQATTANSTRQASGGTSLEGPAETPAASEMATEPPPEGAASQGTTTPGNGAVTEPLQPGARIRYFGDYELLSELARGGMGVV